MASNPGVSSTTLIVGSVAALLLIPAVGAALMIYFFSSQPIVYIVAAALVGYPLFLFFTPRRRNLLPPRPIGFDSSGAVTGPRVDRPMEFGPNGAEVTEFLVKLPLLRPEHWRYVESIAGFSRSSLARQILYRIHRRSDPLMFQEWVPRLRNEEDALAKSLAAFRDIHSDRISDLTYLRLNLAAQGLLYRNVLPRSTFDELYSPFVDLLPPDGLLAAQKD